MHFYCKYTVTSYLYYEHVLSSHLFFRYSFYHSSCLCSLSPRCSLSSSICHRLPIFFVITKFPPQLPVILLHLPMALPHSHIVIIYISLSRSRSNSSLVVFHLLYAIIFIFSESSELFMCRDNNQYFGESNCVAQEFNF